jgi:hypothetical protein
VRPWIPNEDTHTSTLLDEFDAQRATELLNASLGDRVRRVSDAVENHPRVGAAMAVGGSMEG